jgi:hypothetical protein
MNAIHRRAEFMEGCGIDNSLQLHKAISEHSKG